MWQFLQACVYHFYWGRRLFYAYWLHQLKDPHKKYLMRELLVQKERLRQSGKVQESQTINLESIPLDAPPQMVVTPNGVATIDGTGAHVQHPHGVESYIGRDGQLLLTAPATTRIEIVDTNQVVSHQTNQVFSITSHVIHFDGGATLAYMVDAEHGRIELQPSNVCIDWQTEGVLRVSANIKE